MPLKRALVYSFTENDISIRILVFTQCPGSDSCSSSARMATAKSAHFVKILFGHMAWTPTFPSTSWVISTSTATLVSM